MKSRKIFVNPIAKPFQIGIYEDDKLKYEIERDGYVSDYLAEEVVSILENENIDEIIYVNGPGSQMGIKLAYIALKSIETVKNIPLKACSAFALNGGSPIKAMGKLYFIKEKETIITKKLENKVELEFKLMDNITDLKLEKNNLPDYRLPAV